MKLIFTLAYLSLTLTVVSAQDFHKAIVTDVNYLRRTGINVNESTFPFYFHHKEFIQDVITDIRKQLFIQFGVKDIVFINPDSINYVEDICAPILNLKQTAKSEGNPGELFVSVETIIQDAAEINEITNYLFITRIKMVDYKGRIVYKFKNKIPFVVMLDEQITGEAEMGEEDFYIFYLDGIELAFNRKQAKSEKRYILKPQTSYYTDFLSLAEKFYLKREGKVYSYGIDMENQKEVFKFSEDLLNTGSKLLATELFNYYIMDSYQTQNLFSSDSLLVKLRESDERKLKEMTDSTNITLDIFNKNELVGSFTHISKLEISGQLYHNVYTIKWNPNYLVTEIYVNGNQMFLINTLDNARIINVHKSITERQLGEFFNVLFVNDYMLAITQ